jgi:hypothetical protein
MTVRSTITTFTLFLSALAAPLWAQATYTAASCNLSDVQAAITKEQATPADGDIISIPSGTCTWSGTTAVSGSFTTSVTIQGQGAVFSTAGGASTTGSDQTVIIDNLNRPSYTIGLTSAAGKTFRVTGIYFQMNVSSLVAATGILNIGGASSSVRVDHCHFYLTTGSVGLFFGGSVTGVADHNYFDSASGALNNDLAIHNGVNWSGASNGDGSWKDTDHWGSSQFIFVEDNRFHNGDMGDGHDGARYVLRHNYVTADSVAYHEGQMYNHGLTSARGRSVRAAEVYSNSFVMPGTTGVNHPPYSVNGGTLLYWGNTITQYRQGLTLDYTRKDNGTYPYDSPPSGWGNCTGTSGTAWDGPGGYPCLDGTAYGAGDLLSGDFPNVVNTRTGTIAYTNQALTPIYVWNNTYTPAGGYSGPALVSTGTSMITDNREYYQQFGTNAEPGSFNGTAGVGQGLFSARPTTCTAGPGGNTPGVGYWATDQNTLYVCAATNTWTVYYTPYTYPHPLTEGIVTSKPAPPTNLVTVVQ